LGRVWFALASFAFDSVERRSALLLLPRTARAKQKKEDFQNHSLLAPPPFEEDMLNSPSREGGGEMKVVVEACGIPGDGDRVSTDIL